MKDLTKYIFFILSLTFFACAEIDDYETTKQLEKELIENQEIFSIQSLDSADLTARVFPINDPNRNSNWQWYSSTMQTMWTSNSGGLGVIRQKQLPYFQASDIATDASQRDMLPNDGWVLVARDFGFNENHPVEGDPWFLVYNRRRGLLRLCLFNAFGSQYVFQSVRLGLHNNVFTSSGLFTLTSENFQQGVLTNLVPNQVRESISNMAEQGGWSVHDFYLGFDPNFNSNTIFDFKVYGIIETIGSGGISGAVTGKALVTEKNEIKIHDVFKNTGAFLSAVDKKYKKLKLTSFLQSFDIATGAVGIAKFFLGGKKTTQTIPITLDADLGMSFSLITRILRKEIRVNADSTAWINDGFAFKPLNQISYGLINFKEVQKVYLDTEYLSQPSEQYPGECETITISKYATVYNEVLNNISLNPTSGMHIVDIKVAFSPDVFPNSIPSFANSGGYFYTDYQNLIRLSQEIFVKVTLRSLQPEVNMDREYVVIRSIPYQVIFRNSTSTEIC
ncbi:hypothetical protein [Mongoliitalea daihaiensis]|uniref:hypothetical protein n=1 Tax=Mongoliitalea daihaiensis TaxID=2782006 RepID=UPI001F3B7151|nr:hypothetical protein [Mongoliitalea daihaiensis]UJP65810.1 hypothetical protein IPZ59_04080 [Mongoliitalea daihaiensis]